MGLRKGAPICRGLRFHLLCLHPLLFAAFEDSACKGKPNEKIIHGYANCQRRQKSECGPHDPLEYRYETGLQTHVYKMAQCETDASFGIRTFVKSEIAR